MERTSFGKEKPARTAGDVLKMIGLQRGSRDVARPGQINYQLIVDSWHHIILLDIHPGTMWDSRLTGCRNATFEDFKEVDTEH